MKKCEYCAKEISYHQMYCDDDCQLKANNFFEKRDTFSKVFSIFNVIFVFAIPIGLFLYPLVGITGIILVAGGGYGLGLMLIALPFPTESMIRKHKIEKAIKMTRIMGLVMLAFGIGATIFCVLNYA